MSAATFTSTYFGLTPSMDLLRDSENFADGSIAALLTPVLSADPALAGLHHLQPPRVVRPPRQLGHHRAAAGLRQDQAQEVLPQPRQLRRLWRRLRDVLH